MTVILGAEYPPVPGEVSQEADRTARALHPGLVKVRLGCTSITDTLLAIMGCYPYTPNPMVIFRHPTEIPDLEAIKKDFEPYHYALSDVGGLVMAFELMNEPNHEGTRKQLGETTQEQVAEYRRQLRVLIDGMRVAYPAVKLIAPGLMPEPDMRLWAVPERAECDFDGVHVYGTGNQGLQLPDGWQGMTPLVTEINTNEQIPKGQEDERIRRCLEMLEAAYGYGCRRFVFFILPWADMGQWEVFGLTERQAAAYQRWAAIKNGGIPVPTPDGGLARLQELQLQFPDKWAAWAAAKGSVAQNFELFLIGQGDLPQTWDAYDLARNKLLSAVAEEQVIMEGLRPKA